MSAGVYLHIPFCKSRCSYCDFATDVWRDSGSVDRYVRALYSEVLRFESGVVSKGIHAHDLSPQNPDSIYFGGGTPSLLSPDQVELILAAVFDRFNVAGNAEITMEMNPATVTLETLSAYRKLGINRASFGVQTFNDRDLKLLARGHDANDARNTFKMLREAGFDNISFDLIAGLPGQTLADWSHNLEEAIAMQPEHISLYLLEIHEGTPLAAQIRSERRPLPDENLAADMYELMLDRLSSAGYEQYEISNFSRPGFYSRHNTKYWLLEPVYGFGVSAHSFDGRDRYANNRDTAQYVRLIEDSRSAENFRESPDLASEYIFLGLRLNNGLDLSQFQNRFGINFIETYATKIGHLKSLGLIEINKDMLKLTRTGMLYSNEVFSEFI